MLRGTGILQLVTKNNINLVVLAITYLHFRRLCRTLLPMSFARMLMLDCKNTYKPTRPPENIRCYEDGLGKRIPYRDS